MNQYRVGEFQKDDDGNYDEKRNYNFDDEQELICDRCECKQFYIHTYAYGYIVECINCGLEVYIGD